MVRRVILGFICFLFVSSCTYPMMVTSLNYPELSEHAPIAINGNEDLTSQAANEGWLGTGSEDSPIVIADMKIKSESSGIRIEEVSLYFVIENCLIEPYEMESDPHFGIFIENCHHASIEMCVVVGYNIGIFLGNADNAYVYRTEIMSSGFGVFVNESSAVWLHSLDIIVCDIGIRLNHTLYAFIDQTIIDYPIESGIECIKDSGTLLRHNALYGPQQGVVVAESENWVMEETMIHSCGIGIDMIDVSGGFVLRSMISNCSLYGINLNTHTTNITTVQCWLGPNNTQNAQDNGVGNHWCEDYSQIGNYWSDFSGEAPYLIPGDAMSLDLYPTSLDDAPDWNDVITGEGAPIDNTTASSSVTNTDYDSLISTSAMVISFASLVVIMMMVVLMIRSKAGQ
ncbi:hypothetical protein EU528_12440 [Candidatus Thorarchaeota archaeon]|nr:MAG: hypothetical protein EU528_12440 [Candidatus Thorarchaeota archaeon]